MSTPREIPDGREARPAPEVQLRPISALDLLGVDSLRQVTRFDELLCLASRHCRRLVDCENARIWLLRRRGRKLSAREFPDEPGATSVERWLARDEGLAGWVVEHQRPLRLAPGDARPALKGEVAPFHSALVLPLLRRGEVFGAIECLDKRGGGAFTDADFDRLEVSAEHVAFALDNAILYHETEQRALEKEMLLEVAKTLSTPLEREEVIEAILKALRQVVTFDAAAIFLVDRATRALELVSEWGYPGGSHEAIGLQIGQGIVGWVAKTGEPVIAPDVTRDPHYVAARPETRSELAVPLLVEGRTLGVFNLESDQPDAYHEGHLELVTGFAAQAALAVERVRIARDRLERRRLEKELAIAREIQLSFLPKAAPEIPGFELAGTTRPHDEVGGDYYDFIPVSGSRMGLAIADVSGKGIPAALIMAGFRMSLLAEIRNEFALRAVIRKVNSLLFESTDRDKFVTAFYGVLDFRNYVLIFSNAGHNPPILLRHEGGIEYLTEGGVALGVLPDSLYDERPIAVRPGDVLVMYTDGVSEAESPTGEHFGSQRIEECTRRLADRGAAEILEGLLGAALEWAGSRGQSDDLTLLVLKVKAADGG